MMMMMPMMMMNPLMANPYENLGMMVDAANTSKFTQTNNPKFMQMLNMQNLNNNNIPNNNNFPMNNPMQNSVQNNQNHKKTSSLYY
jgi:hypothetical protein